MASLSQSPLWQLTLTRLRIFYREPAAVFWVYGFPLIMALALGIAFREQPQESIAVDLLVRADDPLCKTRAAELMRLLQADSRFQVTQTNFQEEWFRRLQSGRTDVVIGVAQGTGSDECDLYVNRHRTESRLAGYAVEAKLFQWKHGKSPVDEVRDEMPLGSRYIDFLLPGLIGMNLMGGGLWGVGFVLVDIRVRKLLKRFLATPMRRSHFLLAVMLSRLIFTLTDIVILLAFGYLMFGVRCQGSYLDLMTVVFLGGASFAGIGLLVASRAQTVETVSGLMNLVMLPMWILSGVFFSSERFPEIAQPVINLLPLTALNQLLRGIMLDGDSLLQLWPQVAILTAYGVGTFAIALRVFRWR